MKECIRKLLLQDKEKLETKFKNILSENKKSYKNYMKAKTIYEFKYYQARPILEKINDELYQINGILNRKEKK